ncbi:uncharacterized protein LOC108676826 [Hyalella azteca]|uniref:Uncharacterized protein LOC108676826 n=1 Tax=Hyalella azteca TaxID=294128 RepID=A0A8B7P5U6_HYAAZ|nr:uncharacterized protein LOC108676826 [Hyalella azteca]
MAGRCKVYKKTAPNNSMTVYLTHRDFLEDQGRRLVPVAGVVEFSEEQLRGEKLFCLVNLTYRYGRTADETMAHTFHRTVQLINAPLNLDVGDERRDDSKQCEQYPRGEVYGQGVLPKILNYDEGKEMELNTVVIPEILIKKKESNFTREQADLNAREQPKTVSSQELTQDDNKEAESTSNSPVPGSKGDSILPTKKLTSKPSSRSSSRLSDKKNVKDNQEGDPRDINTATRAATNDTEVNEGETKSSSCDIVNTSKTEDENNYLEESNVIEDQSLEATKQAIQANCDEFRQQNQTQMNDYKNVDQSEIAAADEMVDYKSESLDTNAQEADTLTDCKSVDLKEFSEVTPNEGEIKTLDGKSANLEDKMKGNEIDEEGSRDKECLKASNKSIDDCLNLDKSTAENIDNMTAKKDTPEQVQNEGPVTANSANGEEKSNDESTDENVSSNEITNVNQISEMTELSPIADELAEVGESAAKASGGSGVREEEGIGEGTEEIKPATPCTECETVKENLTVAKTQIESEASNQNAIDDDKGNCDSENGTINVNAVLKEPNSIEHDCSPVGQLNVDYQPGTPERIKTPTGAMDNDGEIDKKEANGSMNNEIEELDDNCETKTSANDEIIEMEDTNNANPGFNDETKVLNDKDGDSTVAADEIKKLNDVEEDNEGAFAKTENLDDVVNAISDDIDRGFEHEEAGDDTTRMAEHRSFVTGNHPLEDKILRSRRHYLLPVPSPQQLRLLTSHPNCRLPDAFPTRNEPREHDNVEAEVPPDTGTNENSKLKTEVEVGSENSVKPRASHCNNTSVEICHDVTQLQERLIEKLQTQHDTKTRCVPFSVSIPAEAPNSATLVPGPRRWPGEPVGVIYELQVYAANEVCEEPARYKTTSFAVRKHQLTPHGFISNSRSRAISSKTFQCSPGEIELSVSLNKSIYVFSEEIEATVNFHNKSKKTVKGICSEVIQKISIGMTHTTFARTVTTLESREGCPVLPNYKIERKFKLIPDVRYNKANEGAALLGNLKDADCLLAPTTLHLTENSLDREMGLIVTYFVRVSLTFGHLSESVCLEHPIQLVQARPPEYIVPVTKTNIGKMLKDISNPNKICIEEFAVLRKLRSLDKNIEE